MDLSPTRLPTAAIGTDQRDLRLDACRGLALWFIFLDHVPNNLFSWLTLRNYGFSDTTEIFFFVSGYTCMLAYGSELRRGGWLATLLRTMRRGWEIYVAFLLLLLAYLALVQAVGGDRSFLDDTNTAVFFERPAEAIVRLLTMQYMPVNTDVLPTFVLLHLLFPALLWLMNRAAAVALGLSALLYGLVQAYGWNLPSWPKNEWFFNPLAWQVLFVFGAWYATLPGRLLGDNWWSRAVLALSVLYLAFSFAVVISWQVKAWENWLPEMLAQLIYPVDKSNLAPPRLLHYTALMVVAARFMKADWRGLVTPLVAAMIRCGENSLAIYCLGVLLSFLAGVALSKISGALAMQAALSLAGIIVMIAAATLMTWSAKRRGRGPRLL
jgi:hypothetical protein